MISTLLEVKQRDRPILNHLKKKYQKLVKHGNKFNFAHKIERSLVRYKIQTANYIKLMGHDSMTRNS